MARSKKIKFTEKEYTKYLGFLYAYNNGKFGNGLLSFKEETEWAARNNLSFEQIKLMEKRLEIETKELVKQAINN